MKNTFKSQLLPIGSLGVIPLSLTKIVFSGTEPGKKVCITAMLHGNETTSLFVLHELISLLNAIDIQKGEVIIIPVANPLGLAFGTRQEPLDGENLNREFPGSSTKSLGKRITHALWNELQTADFIIDLHTFTSRQCKFTGVMVKTGTEIDKITAQVLQTIHPECVWLIDMARDEDKRFYGALDVYASEKNIPAITLEMERMINVTSTDISRYVSGIFCALQKLDVINLSCQKNILQKDIPVFEGHYVYCDTAGIFYPKASLLQNVNTNSLLGTYVDVNTFEQKECYAPMEGTLLTLRSKDFVRTGSKLGSIGTWVGSLKDYM